ncbi:hypothetical protein ACF0H5_004811 [Mactra antiquata]
MELRCQTLVVVVLALCVMSNGVHSRKLVLPIGSGFVITHLLQQTPELRRGTVAGEQFNVLKWMWFGYRAFKFFS